MSKYLNPRGSRILAALDAVSGRHRTSLASVALAWLMAQPSIAAPIASATRLEQFDDLAAAASLALSSADLAELDHASAPDPA